MRTIHCDEHNQDIVVYESADEQEWFVDDNKKETVVFTKAKYGPYLKRYVQGGCDDGCSLVQKILEEEMSIYTEKRLACAVAASSSEEIIYTPENERTIKFKEFGGTTPPSQNDIKAEIYWDDELIFVTHGAARQNSSLVVVADGEKQLKLKITNDTDQTETCSVYTLFSEE